MTVLAFNLAGRRNGVSELHGRVTRRMWQPVWPKLPEDQVPISAIHQRRSRATWIAPELAKLFDEFLGADWIANHDDPALWNRISEIPDRAFWNLHLELKMKLLAFAREKTRELWRAGQIEARQSIAMGTY
jgi:starch phosphorylase